MLWIIWPFLFCFPARDDIGKSPGSFHSPNDKVESCQCRKGPNSKGCQEISKKHYYNNFCQHFSNFLTKGLSLFYFKEVAFQTTDQTNSIAELSWFLSLLQDKSKLNLQFNDNKSKILAIMFVSGKVLMCLSLKIWIICQ